MRVKNITVGIKSLEEGLKEFSTAIHAIKGGQHLKIKKEGTYFVDLDAMRRVLTPKRLELLHLIREKEPHSVYELAHLAKRDLKNVQTDVGLLSRIGLLSLNKTKTARENIVPRVDYDQLQLQIPVV